MVLSVLEKATELLAEYLQDPEESNKVDDAQCMLLEMFHVLKHSDLELAIRFKQVATEAGNLEIDQR